MFNNTKLNLVDLAGQGLLNWFGSGYAAQSPTLRWNWGQSDSLFTDYRFAGGVMGTALNLAGGYMGENMMSRIGYDLAAGSLHSLLATEQVRRAAVARLTQGGIVPGAQAQIPSQPTPQLAAPVDVQVTQASGAWSYPGSFR